MILYFVFNVIIVVVDIIVVIVVVVLLLLLVVVMLWPHLFRFLNKLAQAISKDNVMK